MKRGVVFLLVAFFSLSAMEEVSENSIEFLHPREQGCENEAIYDFADTIERIKDNVLIYIQKGPSKKEIIAWSGISSLVGCGVSQFPELAPCICSVVCWFACLADVERREGRFRKKKEDNENCDEAPAVVKIIKD